MLMTVAGTKLPGRRKRQPVQTGSYSLLFSTAAVWAKIGTDFVFVLGQTLVKVPTKDTKC